MARVENFTRRILPTLADPSAVGRIADTAAIRDAGALAQGVSQAADIGVQFALKAKAEEDHLNNLQEQTEMAKRSADYQNRSFEVIQQNRTAFKNNPKDGADALSQSLKDLNQEYQGGLTAVNQEVFNRSQVTAMGRFDLQQKQWAVTQTKKNTQKNIAATGKSYIESARIAGEQGDFDRISNIAQDVSGLASRGAGVLENPAQFSAKLNEGILESFTDSLMFNHTEEFITRMNDGFFDDVMSEEDQVKKKGEAQKFLKTKNDQAQFDQKLNFLSGNASVAKDVANGKLSFNDIDDLISAGNISPEMGEQKRKELLNGGQKVVTDPIVYGNLKAEAQRLLETRTTSTEDDDGVFRQTEKVLGTESLSSALKLQDKIAKMQASGKLKASDGNSLTKMIQIGISNTVSLEGLSQLSSINHYQTAINTFESSGFKGQELINMMREYAVVAEQTGVEKMNDQLMANEPTFLDSFIDTKSSKDREDITKDMSFKIEEATKANITNILSRLAKQNNPSLNTFQGDLPNAIMENGRVSTLLSGGNTAKDATIKVERTFDLQVGQDGNTYRVFKDGSYEIDR